MLPAEVRQVTPVTDFQYVDVTFTDANEDFDIRHELVTSTPDLINYQVVRKDRACDIYHDTSATRKPWTRSYIILRSSVASAVVTLLLTVPRT